MFEFKNDLNIILKTLDISSRQLSKELGFDEPTICNWLNGKYEPDNRSKEDIYSYAYDNGLRINLAYEKPLNELANKQGYIHLYHGSKYGIEGEIDIEKSYENNDFGKGFYLGQALRQSAMFVSSSRKSKVYSYGLYIKGLKIVELDVDDVWVISVAYNRNLLKEYKDSKKLKKILDKTKGADVIVAPIADNRMYDIINEFVDGRITIEACKYGLASLDLGKQYVLKTNKAISKLGFVKDYYLCKQELIDYCDIQNKMQSERIDKIKNFRSMFKKGKYIEEVL